MKFRERDNGADELLRRAGLAGRSPVTIKIGVQGQRAGAARKGTGDTVADVASQHEFGIGVPRRSFIADWADEQTDENLKLLRRIPEAIVRGRPTTMQATEQVALKMVGEVQKRMKSSPGDWEQLSEDYANRVHNGDRTPRLVNTGQLRSSITGLVEVGNATSEVVRERD